MSEIKNSGLDQYGAQLFEQQHPALKGLRDLKPQLFFSPHVCFFDSTLWVDANPFQLAHRYKRILERLDCAST